MKSLTKTAVFFIIALSLTVIAAGTYSYFFLKMKTYVEQTVVLNAKADDLEGREQRITSAATTMKNENTRIENLSLYFIKESEIVHFTEKIEALGKEAGVEELAIKSLESGVGEKGSSTLNFSIAVRGEFQNVIKFTALLENFPAKFDWKNVKLVRENSVSGEVDETTKKPLKAPTPIWSAEISLTALNYVKE